MPRVSELVADRAETDVQCDIGTLHIVYRPRVVTTEWQRKVGEAEARGEGDEVTLFAPLRETIIEWDVTDESDKPYPLTDEALVKLPRQILNQVLLAVVASARPNPQRLLDSFTAGSSGPSTQPTPLTKRRTG